MTTTISRCCDRAIRSLCGPCLQTVPEEIARTVIGTYSEGSVYAHALAVAEALEWLREHR